MTDRLKQFAVDRFYAALDATRQARGLNWKGVGAETKVSASTLSRMAQGKKPDADALSALAAWAGLNPGEFILGLDRPRRAEPLAVISQELHRDPNLSSDAAEALDEIIKTAYQRLRAKNDGRTKR